MFSKTRKVDMNVKNSNIDDFQHGLTYYDHENSQLYRFEYIADLVNNIMIREFN